MRLRGSGPARRSRARRRAARTGGVSSSTRSTSAPTTPRTSPVGNRNGSGAITRWPRRPAGGSPLRPSYGCPRSPAGPGAAPRCGRGRPRRRLIPPRARHHITLGVVTDRGGVVVGVRDGVRAARRGLERQPAVGREQDLDPGVGVVGGDVPQAVGVAAVALREPDRHAGGVPERPQHDGHRTGVLLAEALLRRLQEVKERELVVARRHVGSYWKSGPRRWSWIARMLP